MTTVADTASGKGSPILRLGVGGYSATTPPSNIAPPPSSLGIPSYSESRQYYAGLPSAPILVAYAGTTPWEAPNGSKGLKCLRVVGDHPLKYIWEDDLALKVHKLLDAFRVKWTSTDVVRIGKTGSSFAPVILWIGVVPTSLSSRDGAVVASKCHDILIEYDITDVDVEIRESVVTRSMKTATGPSLLPPARPPFQHHVQRPLARFQHAGIRYPRSIYGFYCRDGRIFHEGEWG